jgi:LmbE family N-acetylglucosaminyl deacetylase
MNHPISNPLQLPIYSVAQIVSESVLVVAPHPDDETLGCGGAIALLRQLGVSVWVLVISDGTQSHPRSVKYPALKLRSLRESETRSAMDILGVESSQVRFLQLPDGDVPDCRDDPAVEPCCDVLKTLMPAIVFVPWRDDPHPDHRATWNLLDAALERGNLAPRVIEYPIWDWDSEQRRPYNGEPMMAWRLDITAVLAQKENAIAAYRSQTTALIDDDPQGFRLTPQMLANFTHPWELYLERNKPMSSSQSLPPEYFENLYQTYTDPWKFATSDYEANKYAATIAALPNRRFHSAFEIGGSIGVLTQKLAEHCDRLLSIDVSESAQQQAIQRCQHLPQVRLQIMQFPQQSPNEPFDLILLSEVGYYWGWEDLQLARSRMIECLVSQGYLLLVHWLPVSPGYPLTGDDVHDFFLESDRLQLISSQREEKYRIDLLQKQ